MFVDSGMRGNQDGREKPSVPLFSFFIPMFSLKVHPFSLLTRTIGRIATIHQQGARHRLFGMMSTLP